jgi:hypothetical protein
LEAPIDISANVVRGIKKGRNRMVLLDEVSGKGAGWGEMGRKLFRIIEAVEMGHARPNEQPQFARIGFAQKS